MTNPYLSLNKNFCLLKHNNAAKCEVIEEIEGSINSDDASRIHNQFRSVILNKGFPCVLARSAFNNSAYRFGVYPDISQESINGLCSNLWDYVQLRPTLTAKYATFISCFLSPIPNDEIDFENILWNILQMLHDNDSTNSAWDKSTSSDPNSNQFAFSFAETSFFVVGIHKLSSRHSRKFPYPCLAFNLHSQFQDLRSEGIFEHMQNVIRKRDTVLQKNINPSLTAHGHDSAAKQYSGRLVESDWKCPFHPKS